jgi:periplasmic divalent cation tolerance protein
MSTGFIQVSVACGSQAEAGLIAERLVERRLAGCVQISGPVESVYRWQGKVETAHEWLCFIKTTDARYAAVEKVVRELHSYECPEIIATTISAGSNAYLKWLSEQVGDN